MKTQTRLLISLALLLTTVAACARPAPATEPAPQPTVAAPARSGTIRFSQAGTANVRDIPSLMAYDVLRQMGYTVEVVPFAKTALIPAALDKGDVDFSDSNFTLISTAVAQGAHLQMVANKQGMSFAFVAAANITDCRQLDQQPVSFSNLQSVGYMLFLRHVAANCPGIKPELVLIPESPNRVAGLAGGQLVAAYLDLQEWVDLQKQQPGKFHVLVDYAAEFPDTIILPVTVRRDWAKENVTIVHDYLRALLEAQRAVIADPQLLADNIVKYLSIEPARARDWADAYLKIHMWSPNGGLTEQNVRYTLSMLIDGQLVPAGIKPEDVADLSYLNTVLDEIGRQ